MIYSSFELLSAACWAVVTLDLRVALLYCRLRPAAAIAAQDYTRVDNNMVDQNRQPAVMVQCSHILHKSFWAVAIAAAMLFAILYHSQWPYESCLRSFNRGCRYSRTATVRIKQYTPAQQASAGLHSLAAGWSFKGVQQCISEGHSELCVWCNCTFVEQYPLAEKVLRRSFLPGAQCSMPPGLLEKLQKGHPISIVVLGGSMTAGHGCYDKDRRGNSCSWPRRMQDKLQELYPLSNITVTNMARPGFCYTNVLSSGLIHNAVNADVLLIDLQVNSQIYNDVHVQMEEVDELIYQALSLAQQQRRHLGIMFVESFRTCSTHQADCNKHCPARRQGHLMYNHTGRQTTYSYCDKWWNIASFERPVVAHYGIPIASYRDAVWPDISTPSATLPCFWNGLSHPDAVGHIMMADVVAYGFLRAIGAGSAKLAMSNTNQCTMIEPIKFHQQAASARYCSASVASGTIMTAEQPSTFAPLAATGCWTYFEDRPGKPGWICQQDQGSELEDSPALEATSQQQTGATQQLQTPGNSTGRWLFTNTSSKASQQQPLETSDSIVFQIKLSSTPQLQLTYLTSYTNMGVAEVTIYARNASTLLLPAELTQLQPLAMYRVDSAIRERFSIPRTSVFVHPTAWQQWQHHPHANQLPAGLQQGNYLVALRPAASQATGAHGKFKLLSLSSC